MRSRARSAALGLSLSAWATTAWAEGPSASEQMLAQSLFEEGRQLMDRGQLAAACPKLAESQRLDPGGGTLLNLAICHEKEGRVGTAYMEMKAASSQAAKEARKDREKIANEHLGALASRVPRLAVHVAREDADLEVRVDGTVLRKPAWDLLTVVDPGQHVIDASAPGKAPFRKTITLAEAEQRTEQVPALAASGGTTSPDVASSGGAPAKRTNPWWVASIVTSVTGVVVALPAAYVVGMMAVSESTCDLVPGSPFCASDGVRTAWTVTLVAGLSAGVLGAIGIAAFPARVKVSASPTPTGAAAVLVTSF